MEGGNSADLPPPLSERIFQNGFQTKLVMKDRIGKKDSVRHPY